MDNLDEATTAVNGANCRLSRRRTKQEEIREGAIGVLQDARLGDCDCDECSGLLVDAVFSYLKSVGVVIKVGEPFGIAKSINGDRLVAVEELI